jgi:5-methyltetrahydropteroyltriglutamate--homocysteine methyltransferase
MKLSRDCILTTHIGSLPRPDDLIDLLRTEDRGEPFDREKLEARFAATVKQTVADQAKAGVDIVGDGDWTDDQFAAAFQARSPEQ